MHNSVYEYTRRIIRPEHVTGKNVLEIGALNENGSIRPDIVKYKPSSYIATDMRPGKGVGVVGRAEHLKADIADLVISQEMLEHAEHWQEAVLGMARACRLGGHLLLTTRSLWFPYHGYPDDYWRFRIEVMEDIVRAAGFDGSVEPDPESAGVFVFGKKVAEANREALMVVKPDRVFPDGSVQCASPISM